MISYFSFETTIFPWPFTVEDFSFNTKKKNSKKFGGQMDKKLFNGSCYMNSSLRRSK